MSIDDLVSSFSMDWWLGNGAMVFKKSFDPIFILLEMLACPRIFVFSWNVLELTNKSVAIKAVEESQGGVAVVVIVAKISPYFLHIAKMKWRVG